MKILKSLFVLSFFSLAHQVLPQDIVINEIMSSNSSTISDIDGDFSDWIELYNTSEETVNLENFSLTDDEDALLKWTFPNIEIPSNSFLIVFASGKNLTGTELHTNFKIKQDGEELFLVNSQNEVISNTPSVSIQTDKSYGLFFDGGNEYSLLSTPTPNETNASSNSIYCSHLSGFYDTNIIVSLTPSDVETDIYYTTNGETPTANSLLYDSEVVFTNISDSENIISDIPTTPLVGPYQLDKFIWKQPETVYKTNILRYASFENGIQQSKIYSKTFFIDPEIDTRYNFAVTSLQTDNHNLFDYEDGIYIPGKYFDEHGFGWFPTGNYYLQEMENEKEIHLTHFKKDGSLAFESDAGMRMRGNGSTATPQKSFNVYFRSDYGLSNIDYKLFDNSNNTLFKRLVFRNSGNDFLQTHFRDAVLQDVLSPLDLELQEFTPTELFINGEYWGIHNIREKYDEHYFENKYGIDSDELNFLGICGGPKHGNNDDYVEMKNYLNDNDMKLDVHYDFIKTKIDIENFMDFIIAEIYFAHYDWPCNNFKIWNTNEEGSKLRFMIYDLDLSTGYSSDSKFDKPSLYHATESGIDEWPHCDCSNLIIRKLLNNTSFKNEFIDRFKSHLNTVFSDKIVQQKIDEYHDNYKFDIAEHIQRWGYPKTVEKWEDEIFNLKTFFKLRQCFMRQHLHEFFELPSEDCYSDPEDENEFNVVIYPNPTHDNIITVHSSRYEPLSGYSIVGIDGKIVQEAATDNFIIKINVANLSPGIYLLYLNNKEKTGVGKLIISN